MESSIGSNIMRKTIIHAAAALVIGGAGVLAFAAAASASTTPVTVEITGGALTISAPAEPVDLGSAAGSISTQTISGPLGPVVVTDDRADVLGWVTTAASTDFLGRVGIPATAVTYTPGTAFVTGQATVTPTTVTGMTAGGDAVQTATAVNGVNTATWTPSIAVLIPAGAVAGTYSATITHSVS
jgi:hypothetical protein